MGTQHENSPDRSVAVKDLGLDHFPKAVNGFPNVKHGQRHGTGEPQRCLRNVDPRTYKSSGETEVD